jgi:hypothetical protein
MGIQVIFDIVSSMAVGGILLFSVMAFQSHDVDDKRSLTGAVIAQEVTTSLTEVLQDDFGRIGYCAMRSNMAPPFITAAGPNSITFKTDTLSVAGGSGDGVVDLISYQLGDFMGTTPNPRDRALLRSVNSMGASNVSIGLTYFGLKYYDANGVDLGPTVSNANLKLIASVDVTLRCEDAYASPYSDNDLLLPIHVYERRMRFAMRNQGSIASN